MARESIFARKKRERGSNWVNEIRPDELTKMCENILNDIAYGNLSSNEDKWYLVSDPVINSLINFCNMRYFALEYVNRCIELYRNSQANLVANGGDNTMYAAVYENINTCYLFYGRVLGYLKSYYITKDPTCMINLYSDCAEHRNWINPNRFI